MADSRRRPSAIHHGLPCLFLFVSALSSVQASAQDVQSPPVGPQGGGAEQSRIQAAKRHPVATPDSRPLYPSHTPPTPAETRPLYPSTRPQPRAEPERLAEAPVPAAPSAPASPYRSDPPARVEAPEYANVVAPIAPPALRVETVVSAPAPGYVWAPGYWYWDDDDYVWIPGEWIAPRHGYVYVGSRWVHTHHGWHFRSGGWSLHGGEVVAYPVYRHRNVWSHPHNHGYYRYGYRRSHPASTHYHRHTHRAPRHRYHAPPARAHRRNAPAAYPRASRPVHVRPRH